MSIDRGHDIPTGYQPVDQEVPVEADRTNTYQIPEQNGFQGDLTEHLGRDRAQELVDRTAARMEAGDVPDEDEARGFWTKTKVAVAAGATAVVAAGAIFGASLARKDSSEAAPTGNTEPSVSAPANPGPAETAASTPEQKEVTRETAEFNYNGETITGVDNLIIKYAVIRDNVENPPALTMEQGTELSRQFFNTMQVAANMTTDPESKPFQAEATQYLLFKQGENGALQGLISEIQDSGAKITSVDVMGPAGKPEKGEVMVVGQGTLTVQERDGTEKKYFVVVPLDNDSGLIHTTGATVMAHNS